jgi:hypothetical protein
MPMKQKNVPFYANHEDDMHCMLSVYRSLFDYFLNTKLSWSEIEEITGYKPNKAAWSIKVLIYMSEYFDIKMVEPFDYKKYFKDGESYLYTLFSKEELDWQIKNSNILEFREYIPEFLEKLVRFAEVRV